VTKLTLRKTPEEIVGPAATNAVTPGKRGRGGKKREEKAKSKQASKKK